MPEKATPTGFVRARSQWGSSSVEFVGILPAAVLVVMLAAQFVTAGWALWSASVAARAGARAAHAGDSVVHVARDALPELMRDGAVISEGAGGRVSARVPVPRVLPFLPEFRVKAGSALEPAGG